MQFLYSSFSPLSPFSWAQVTKPAKGGRPQRLCWMFTQPSQDNGWSSCTIDPTTKTAHFIRSKSHPFNWWWEAKKFSDELYHPIRKPLEFHNWYNMEFVLHYGDLTYTVLDNNSFLVEIADTESCGGTSNSTYYLDCKRAFSAPTSGTMNIDWKVCLPFGDDASTIWADVDGGTPQHFADIHPGSSCSTWKAEGRWVFSFKEQMEHKLSITMVGGNLKPRKGVKLKFTMDCPEYVFAFGDPDFGEI